MRRTCCSPVSSFLALATAAVSTDCEEVFDCVLGYLISAGTAVGVVSGEPVMDFEIVNCEICFAFENSTLLAIIKRLLNFVLNSTWLTILIFWWVSMVVGDCGRMLHLPRHWRHLYVERQRGGQPLGGP